MLGLIMSLTMNQVLVFQNLIGILLNSHLQFYFVCAEGGSAGKKVALLEHEVFFGNKLYAIHSPAILESKYIFYYCISGEFFDAFRSAMVGLIGGVSIDKFGNLLLPLPPSAEQKRIIKKVDEIMVLINQLRDIVGDNKTGSKGRPKK